MAAWIETEEGVTTQRLAGELQGDFQGVYCEERGKKAEGKGEGSSSVWTEMLLHRSHPDAAAIHQPLPLTLCLAGSTVVCSAVENISVVNESSN